MSLLYRKRICFGILLIGAALLIYSPTNASAQTAAEEVIQNVLRSPEDTRTRLFVLQFGATGMTEFAAKAFSNMISRNLDNTNRFEVIPLDQIESEIQKQAPTLLPCFDISCGIQMAKIVESDWVLSGHISLTDTGLYSLNVKLVHVMDNSLEFEDTIRFRDENMDRRFFQVADRISNSTPLIGKILEANNKIAVVNLGKENGISVGDQLAIYRNKRFSDENQPSQSQLKRRQNIGILKITKVGKQSSEGVFFQTIQTPEPNQFVSAYLDKRKQIKLIDDVRKELDTHQRNVYEIKKSVELSPIQLEDMAKRKWLRKLRITESDRDFWRWIVLGSGAATAYFLFQFQDGDDIWLLSSLGAFGYSTFEYFSIKSDLDELVEEGKYKGYINLEMRPGFNEARINFGFRF